MAHQTTTDADSSRANVTEPQRPTVKVPGSAAAGQRMRPSVHLSAWARGLAAAPETRPADAAERSADAAADAAARSGPSEPPLGTTVGRAGTASDASSPPWGAGRALSPDEREWHEPRLGGDLGDVRVHEGAAPARWARGLGARAFSFGRDVVLGSGEYAPGSQAGRHLMAHELSHVVAGRGQAPVLARVALTAADYDALADSIHTAVGSSTSDEEFIYVALQKLERDATAITSLKSAYKNRFKTELLADLTTRLKGHGLGLAKTLLGQAGGLPVAAATPSTPAQFESAARAVHTALTGKTTDPESVYAALIPLGRAASAVTTLKTAYSNLFKSSDIEADITSALTGADRSYALYLLEAPGPASPHTPPASVAYVTTPQLPTNPPPANIGGGTVSVGTAVPYSVQPKDPAKPVVSTHFGFGYGYSGALASDTRFIQFIERGINSTKGTTTTPVTADFTSGSRTYPLTTNPAQPNWIVDSDYASDPFFDQAHPGESWRDAVSVSAYDSPGWSKPLTKAQFQAGATTVTSRAHFDIYLIRDFAPIFHIEVEIIWTLTHGDADHPAINRQVKSTGAVTSLPTAQKAALVARYPAFAYIQ